MFLKFKTETHFAFVLIAAFTFVVFNFYTTTQAQGKSANSILITVEAQGCLGTCPVYTAQIFSDGTVVYNGKDYVKVIGERRHIISRDVVTELIEEFRRIKFLSLKEVYDAGELEQPAFITTVSLDGKQKKVTNYSGAPKELNELEVKILKATNLFDHIGPL